MTKAASILSRDEVQSLIGEALATQAAAHATETAVRDAAIAELKAAVQAMQSRGASPNVFEPLKRAAAVAQVDYENARRWCEAGLVNAKKIKGRWVADPGSLAAHAALTR